MADSDQELEAAFAEFTKDTSGPEVQGTEGGNSAESQPTQTGEGQSQEVQWPLTVAGRTYKSPEELVKSHDSLYRAKSRIEQEVKSEREWARPWREYEKALNTDPELYKWLKSAEAKYRESRSSGSTPAQAKAEGVQSGVPKEVMEKIQRLEQSDKVQQAEREERRLESELSSVKQKFSLDDVATEKVIDIMLSVAKSTGLEIDPEEAYWRLQAMSHRDQLSMKTKELDRTRADASIGSSQSASTRAPAQNPGLMGDADFGKSLNSWADKIGLTD